MKLKYFQGKFVYFKEKYEVVWVPCPAVSLKSFRVSSAWMASYSVYKVCKKHQVRNFRLPGSA